MGERIEITHRSSSRSTYAQGSLRVCRFLAKHKLGLFDMQDVFGCRLEFAADEVIRLAYIVQHVHSNGLSQEVNSLKQASARSSTRGFGFDKGDFLP